MTSPLENRARAKEIILEILRAAGEKLRGTTRLYKAFYYAHLFYYKDGHGLLSDWAIVKMPNGPGIDEGDRLIQEMIDDGLIQRTTRPAGPYSESCFNVVGGQCPAPRSRLSDDEREAIQTAVDFVKRKSATKLSALTHAHSRSWELAQNGEPLNVYIDLLEDEEYEKRVRQIRALHSEVAEIF